MAVRPDATITDAQKQAVEDAARTPHHPRLIAPRAIIDATMSEMLWQLTITDLCDTLHLPWFHDQDSRRNNSGFPDLVIPAPPVLHLWEMKAATGRMRPEQVVWGDYLSRCTMLDYRVLRPRDWDFVAATLERAWKRLRGDGR